MHQNYERNGYWDFWQPLTLQVPAIVSIPHLADSFIFTKIQNGFGSISARLRKQVE